MAKVIIVEDEAIIAMESKLNLSSIGHEVKAIVSTAEDAISAFCKFTPDLIIMDIKLNGLLDGLDAIKEIRKHSAVPVLLITGNSDTKTMERINLLTNIRYLLKPILTDDLIREVNKILSESLV